MTEQLHKKQVRKRYAATSCNELQENRKFKYLSILPKNLSNCNT